MEVEALEAILMEDLERKDNVNKFINFHNILLISS